MFLQHLRKKSIFYKTFFLLFALSLLTIAIFAPFITYLDRKSERENVDELNLHQLTRISSDVELVFDLLSQSMTRSMWSSDFIDLMLHPDQHDADTEYRVISVLRDQVDENELVRKSYLYLPGAENVYVYTGSRTERKYLGDRELVEKYLEIRAIDRDPEEVSHQEVMIFNRRIFVATDFCIPNYVGTLFYEIDRQGLYEVIQQENAKFDTTIYVYDAEGRPLFDYMAAGPQESDFENPSLFETSPDENQRTASYYLYTSTDLGWKYLIKINRHTLLAGMQPLAALLLPVLLLYFLVSQGFSWYITRSVYRPINRLMNLIVRPQEGAEVRKSEVKNEVDFLEHAFLNSLEKNEQNQALMLNLGTDIEEQFFRTLLMNRNIDQEYMEKVRTTLTQIGREHWLEGSSHILLFEIAEEDMQSHSILEQELYIKALNSAISNKNESDVHIIGIPIGAGKVAQIICYGREYSVSQIREMSQSIQTKAIKALEDFPVRVWTSSSRPMNDLSMMRSAYLEAENSIRYARYQEKAESADEEESADSGDLSQESQESSRFFTEQMSHVFELLEKGEDEKAGESVELVLKEIDAHESTANGYAIFISRLTEQMIAKQISQEAIRNAGIEGGNEKIRELDPTERRSYALDYYQGFVRLITENSQRSHNMYVEAAKAYIEKNYSDGKLSLDGISEFVGVSAAYLSRLFSESTKVGINAWINDFRIQQSKRYLSQTTLNISEVGYQCGFNSAQNFTRTFKKFTGLSPKQYREQGGETEKAGETNA